MSVIDTCERIEKTKNIAALPSFFGLIAPTQVYLESSFSDSKDQEESTCQRNGCLKKIGGLKKRTEWSRSVT